MTLGTVSPQIDYLENGATTTHAIPFQFLNASDIVCYRITAAGAVLLIQGVHYNVTGGNGATGTVTKTSGGTNGATFRIMRSTTRSQPMDLIPHGDFPADDIEVECDRVSMVNQEQDVRVADLESRSIRAPFGETLDALPPASTRGNTILGFLANGARQLFTSSMLASFVAAPLLPLLGQLTKGDPGGNAMAIGLFIAASTLAIPGGTDLVRTSGYGAVGRGAADYFYDAAVDATYVTANPRTSFLAFNGRGFRLDPSQFLSIEKFGAIADWNGGVGSDNLAALNAAKTFQPVAGLNMTPLVWLEPGKYYSSATFEVDKVVHFIGHETGSDESSATGIGGTSIVTPVNTVTCRIHNSDTVLATVRTPGDSNFSGAGSILAGICFEQATLGNDLTAHGVWMRATATLERCAFRNVAGNAIHNVAYSAGAGAFRGNTSEWRVINCIVYSAGGDCLHTNGGDANAGYCIGFKTKSARGCGIYDTNTFGNTYIAPQITGYGGTDGQACGVTYGGRHYQLVASVEIGEGLGSTTQPGTNQNVWYDLGPGVVSSPFPNWVNGNAYTFHSPIHIAGNSNASNVFHAYIEGGNVICHADGPAYIVPGFSVWTNLTPNMKPTGGGNTPVACPTGVGAYKTSSGPTQAAQFGANQFTHLGAGNPNSSDYSPDIVSHYKDLDGINLHFGYDVGVDPVWYYANRKILCGFTGPRTTKTFGRDVAQPDFFMAYDVALVDSTNNANIRLFGLRAGPAGGYHAKGEIFLNVNPAASGVGSNAGWKIVTSGNPGTWAQFGGTADHQANSAAADVATIVADFNALLGKLQAAGLMA